MADDRCHSGLILLHWLTLTLLVAVRAHIEMRGIFPRGSGGREFTQHWHFMLGPLVPGPHPPGRGHGSG